MKKISVIAFTAILSIALIVPAFALENDFGGYWRTRAFSYKYYSGQQSTVGDTSYVDTRTRLYYTAKINDNLKLVNKFEMDARWGDSASYGDVGTDAVVVEVKNTYADFNLGKLNAKIGAQGGTIARGFIFADDFAGATLTFNASDKLSIPFMWIKAYDGNPDATNDTDVDWYAVAPVIKISPKLTINPYLAYITSTDASAATTAGAFRSIEGMTPALDDFGAYLIGADVDANLGKASLWASLIYEGGTLTVTGVQETYDISAYLAAFGGSMDLGKTDLHGQMFYASGEDLNEATDDHQLDAFYLPQGQSYYWAEIMGYGVFDEQVSHNSPADAISDVMAINLGTTMKPMAKLSLSLDLWYAQLDQDIAWTLNGTKATSKDLGTEVDFKASYQLIEGLNLDVVAAYLFAGDATTYTNGSAYTSATKPDSENPYEVGTQLSLSF